MNTLSLKEKTQIISCLVEGNSIRSTCRITGRSKGAVLKLLAQVGTACSEYQHTAFRNLQCRRLQCDEIWSFVGAKERNVPQERKGEYGIGDVWTWTAICADTKLVPSWLVGLRNAECAYKFLTDLADRLANRVQLTTDGHRAYLDTVYDAFGVSVDYAMLIKMFGKEQGESATRYSPPKCIGCEKHVITGNPDPEHVSTSYVERQNLTMRMSMRRFTRLTNAFSKKVENLEHAVALHFAHYNLCRIHQSLRITPAMAAGVSDHVWSIEEIAALIPAEMPKKRGPYKKRSSK